MEPLTESVEDRDAYQRGYIDGRWEAEKDAEIAIDRAFDDGFDSGYQAGSYDAVNYE